MLKKFPKKLWEGIFSGKGCKGVGKSKENLIKSYIIKNGLFIRLILQMNCFTKHGQQ